VTWVQIDDGMADHPKIMQLSHGAFRLQVEGLCFANRNLTDGFVPFLAAHRHGKRFATELVKAAVWDDAEGGYSIHDFADYQPSRESVLERRSETAERVRNWRRNKQRNAPRNAVTNSVSNPVSNAGGNGPVTLSPDPVPVHIPKEDQSSPSLAATDHLTVKDKSIPPGTAVSIERLLERLPDADQGTVGRLVLFAKHGAVQADFEDARAVIGASSTRSPSRYACSVIAQRLEKRTSA
jgi:hypothetical protein